MPSAAPPSGHTSASVLRPLPRVPKFCLLFPAVIHIMMKLMGLTKDDLGMMDSLYMKATDTTIDRNFTENYTYHTRPEIAETETKVCL